MVKLKIDPTEGAVGPDWAPRLASIWDVGEERSSPQDDEGSAATPPWPVAPGAPGWLDPSAWIQADAAIGRSLAEATAPVIRLDERLLGLRAGAHKGAREGIPEGIRRRIALSAVPDQLWAEGARIRPEYLALAGADRVGGGEDAPDLARAAWAVRRMTAGPALDPARITPAAMRAFLGMHGQPGDGRSAGAAAKGGLGLPAPGFVDPAALVEWCRALTALDTLHPLTRAVAGGALWTGLGVTDPAWRLEAALVTGALAAAAGQGGLLAMVPGPSRASLGEAGQDAGTRLEAGLTRIAEAARAALMLMDRVAAWQARAARSMADQKGRGPDALIALLAARPVASARDIATELALTDRHARRLTDRFAAQGLVRELTGHSRFRYWAAKL